MGSDSEFLKHGNDAFDTVLEKHPTHPLADYVRFIRGINKARAFKTITAEKKLLLRKPMLEETRQLLTTVVDSSAKGKGIDAITINETVLAHLATAHRNLGDTNAALATEKRIKPKVAKAARAA